MVLVTKSVRRERGRPEAWVVRFNGWPRPVNVQVTYEGLVSYSPEPPPVVESAKSEVMGRLLAEQGKVWGDEIDWRRAYRGNKE